MALIRRAGSDETSWCAPPITPITSVADVQKYRVTKKSNYAAKVGRVSRGTPAFADTDITLLTATVGMDVLRQEDHNLRPALVPLRPTSSPKARATWRTILGSTLSGRRRLEVTKRSASEHMQPRATARSGSNFPDIYDSKVVRYTVASLKWTCESRATLASDAWRRRGSQSEALYDTADLKLLIGSCAEDTRAAKGDGNPVRPPVRQGEGLLRGGENDVERHIFPCDRRAGVDQILEVGVLCLAGIGDKVRENGEVAIGKDVLSADCRQNLVKRIRRGELSVEDVVVGGEADGTADIANGQGDGRDRSDELRWANDLGNDRARNDHTTNTNGCEHDDCVDGGKVVDLRI
nr:hypothetical protein CFP56_20998 [Quercus suber]